jgi:hypothetical protein
MEWKYWDDRFIHGFEMRVNDDLQDTPVRRVDGVMRNDK